MSVDDVRARLREEGEEVARGAIRVDSDKALFKLRFRLKARGAYVLDLLRAAVASGATRLELRCDADDVELVHDGQPVGADVLRDIYVHALGEGRESEAGWLLASGLNCAMGFYPRWITVDSGASRLRLTSVVTIAVEDRPPATATRLHLKHGLRLAASRLLARKPELALVRSHARHLGVKLHVNGERVDAPPLDDQELIARREVTDGPLRLVAGLAARPRRDGARVTVAVHGVDVSTQVVAGLSPHLVVWARHDGLKLDASRSDVVKDDLAYLALLERLPALSDDLLEDALEQLEARREAVTDVALAALDHTPSSRARERVSRARLLPGPSGEWVSPADLLSYARRRGVVRVAFEPLPAGSYEPPAVLLDPEPRAMSLVPTGKRLDVIEEARARARREANRSRFESQPVEEARLPPHDDVATAPIEGRDLDGEVGLPRAGRGATVRFLLEGRLLAVKEVTELQPLRLRATVSGGRFRATEAWDDLQDNAAVEHAVKVIRKAARRALLGRLDEVSLAGEDGDALRGHARDLLRDLAGSRDPIPDALRSAGIFRTAGGGTLSLAEMSELEELRTIDRPHPQPALDGLPVVVLSDDERTALDGLLSARLVAWGDRLLAEKRIRARLDGPRVAPVLRQPVFASVPVEGTNTRGALGLPMVTPMKPEIQLLLLRDGIPLVDRTLPARYAGVVAVVDHPGLTPTDEWDDVVKSGVYPHVVKRIADAEERLAGALLDALPGTTMDALPAAVRTFLLGFMLLELGSPSSRSRAAEHARRVLDAPLWRTLDGRKLSLADLARLVAASDELLPALDPSSWGVAAPPTMTIVLVDAPTQALLGEILGRACCDARDEIPRAQRRHDHTQRPVREPTLALAGVPVAPIAAAAMRGELAHRPGGTPGADVELLVRGRHFARCEIPGVLPTVAIVDLLRDDIDVAEEPTRSLRKTLQRLVRAAELELVAQAANGPEAPGARELLLELFALGADEELASSGTTRAAALKLFPTLGGGGISCDELAGAGGRIGYVRRHLPGALPGAQAVIVATDPALLRVLEARWPDRIDDVTEKLADELALRQRQEHIPRVDEVRVAGEALWRQPIGDTGMEGEVALGAGGEELRLFVDRRPLAVSPLEGPPGVAAAVNCDALRFDAAGQVRRDEALGDVVRAVQHAIGALADTIARDWSSLSPERRDALSPAVAGLAGWLLERGRSSHPAVQLPVLVRSDGGPLSFAGLLSILRRDGAIKVAEATGELHDPDDLVWRPRPHERALAARLSWKLEDATRILARAEASRRKAQVTSLGAPLASPWREPIVAAGIEGELAAAERPSGRLLVEYVRDGRIVETHQADHPVGLVARVRCDQLRLHADGEGVRHDDTFRRVGAAIEAALERLVARLLAGGGAAAPAYARAAARWAGGRAGPVAEALSATALFEDLQGRPITVGRVRAEAAERGSVAALPAGTVLPEGWPPRLVLALGPDRRELLDELGVPVSVMSTEARRANERCEALELRRRAVELHERDALARVTIDEDGWRGRLALVDEPGEADVILFQRGGVIVDALPAPGKTGILENERAVLEPDGLCWRLADADRTRALAFGDLLHVELAARAAELPPGRRPAAARVVLSWLAERGAKGPQSLDVGGDVGATCARAPLFLASGGRWVSLRALADHVVRRGALDVIPADAAGDEVTEIVLVAPRRADPPWLGPLEALLGGNLRRFPTVEAWRRHRRDAEPDESDPLFHGLQRLRAEAEHLRAGAFSRLGPRELAHLRLRRAGGARPVIYEPTQAIAFLDPEHEAVAAALADAASRPDRLYVLLAAIYGAVNRWLDHVTDEDEATACGALLDHAGPLLRKAQRTRPRE